MKIILPFLLLVTLSACRNAPQKPHTVECAKYAGYKIVETDTGKEFPCCSEHIKNYRDYSANREVFVIVF